MNGALIALNRCSGRDSARATRSARVIASIFGTCSPIVMCSEVATTKEIANAIAVAPVPSPSAGSISCAIAGSPRKPIPIEARVIPNWQAASDSSILSSCSSACSAPDSPSLASASIRPLAGAHERELGSDEEPVERARAGASRTRKSAVTADQGGAVMRPRTSGEVVVHGGRRKVAAAVANVACRFRRRLAGLGRAAVWRPPALHRRRARDNVLCVDQDQTPYLDALIAYADRNPGRFHVPGHKGGPGADPAPVAIGGSRPCASTSPRGSRGSTSARIQRGRPSSSPSGSPPTPGARGAAGSWSTAPPAATTQSASRSRTAATASSSSATCTRRIIDGLILSGMRPRFVAPELDPELGIAHCLTPDSLAAALDAAPDAVAALIVTPTYFGAVADVAALAEVAPRTGSR